MRRVIWYWCLARGEDQWALIGPYSTEYDANQEGYRNLHGSFTVLALPTRDRARATQMVKARRLSLTQNLGESLEKIRHPG